jgi:RNA polymerase sigma-70 factor (ECF subfamily)
VDPEVVEKAMRGEPAALDAVLRAVTPRLWRLAMRLTCEATSAEDLVLETLYRGAVKLRTLRRPDALEAWFCRVLVNAWRDGLRPGRRDVLLDELPEPAAPRGDDPSARLEASELSEAVAAALARLPPGQRAVLALRVDEGLSVTEIARALGSTAERVKANLWHARRRLKDLLGGVLDGISLEEEA